MTKAPSAVPAARRKLPVSVRSWPNPQLIAAILGDPPNLSAYDELAERYWKQLFGRCRLLTVDAERAVELAQDTWWQVLRERHPLNPDADFSSLLMTTAIRL